MSEGLNLEPALRLLTRREHGAYELQQKLQRKGLSLAESQALIKACQHLNYQSDHRFIEMLCRARVRQGYGPLRIVQELNAKKIETPLIKKAFVEAEIDWVACAAAAWQKKFKGTFSTSLKEQQKYYRFLAYRGFSSDTIKEALNQHSSQSFNF